MEHVTLYPKIYQTVNRNPKTFNEFGKMCGKNNKPIPKPFNKVKVISFKVILHKLWTLAQYRNIRINM